MYAWPGAFVLALLLGTGVALNSRDRQALSEAFEVLCPESSVCANDGNMTLGDIQTSCCTSCSCDPTCGDLIPCCFPEDDMRYRQLDTGLFQCLHIGSIEKTYVTTPSEFIPRYFMVSGTAVHTDDFDTVNTSCGEQKAAPWGNMYPVYSITSGTTYKNDICAANNGVGADDMIYFKPHVTCVGIVRMTALIQGLQYAAPWPHNCYLDFSKPDDITANNLIVEECFPDLHNECPDNDFPIPNGMESRAQIKRLCESGIVSPWRNQSKYANPFCMMCNPKLKSTKQGSKCSPLPLQVRHANSALTILLDFVPKHKQAIEEDTTRYPVACSRTGLDVISVNYTECRTIHCPTGQLRNLTNGECFFPSTRWSADGYTYTFKLTPLSPVLATDIGPLPLYESRFIHLFQSCNIVSLFSTVDHGDDGSFTNISDSVSFFLAQLICPSRIISPKQYLSSIQKKMDEQWLFVKESGTTVQLDVEFFGTVGAIRVPVNNTFIFATPLYMHDGRAAIKATFQLLISATQQQMQKLFYSKIYNHIHKLFFCEQVVLATDEFEILTSTLTNHKVILYTPTNTTLYGLEFDMVHTNDMGKLPRICLHDTNLIKKSELFMNNAPLRTVLSPHAFIVTALIAMAHIY